MKRLSAISWIGMTMFSSLGLFYACEDGDKIQVNEQSAATDDRGGGAESDLPYLNPIPLEPIPDEIRGADEATALGWAMNLSRDDLQRYGIVGVRGADPRRDVPEEYDNRDDVIEMLFKIGLYAGGVESIADPSRWIREHSNHEQGGIQFIMLDRDGPDWGWSGGDNALDIQCDSPISTKSYYLWRTNGSSGGTIFPWKSSPESADSNRRITTDSSVATNYPPYPSYICTISLIYKSETSQDCRFVQGTTTTSSQYGYHKGIGSTHGQNIRPSGVPYWQRTEHWDCITSGGNCPAWCELSVPQPDNVNPPWKYLSAETGNGRYKDYFKTPCTDFTCDSCWFFRHAVLACQSGTCCDAQAGPLDSCYFTTGTHEGAEWYHGDFPDDHEDYYYAGPGDNGAEMQRVVEYQDSAFVSQYAGTYSRGGWMNQVVYSSASSGGTYSELDDDGVTTPAGSMSQNGNSQSIKIGISVNDSAAWLNNKYLRIGCRPFWKWSIMKTGTGIVPYYLQLGFGTTAAISCSGSGYSIYNDWNISDTTNPLLCTAEGNNFYAGCVTWDTGNLSHAHAPWNGGATTLVNGWLYPCVCVVRQVPDEECGSDLVNSTYYPMRSELAFGTDAGGGTYFKGSYLYVTYHQFTW